MVAGLLAETTPHFDEVQVAAHMGICSLKTLELLDRQDIKAP
jgi:hypothetical protein